MFAQSQLSPTVAYANRLEMVYSRPIPPKAGKKDMDSVAIDVKVVSCLPVISPRETSHDGKIFYKGQLLTMAEFEAKGYRDELSNRSILCPDEFDGYRFICGLLVNEAAYHEIMTGLYASGGPAENLICWLEMQFEQEAKPACKSLKELLSSNARN